LPDALEALAGLKVPVVDRAMLERLLGIHRRAAIRLMGRFGGYQSGKTFFIEREKLAAALEALAAGEAYQFEAGRRERLGKQLAETARENKARRIKIPIAPDVRGREVAGLPATIRLAPGRLEISCTDPTDLLSQLMELAQAISNDYENFEARLRE
jgi:hypothetical protein